MPVTFHALGENHAAESNDQRSAGNNAIAIVSMGRPLGNDTGQGYAAPHRLQGDGQVFS